MLIDVCVISLMRHVTIVHVCVINVVDCLVVDMLGGVRLVHFKLVDLSGRCCVRGVPVMLGVACSIVCEMLCFYVLMLRVAVV